MTTLNIEEIMRILPHRYPMLLIDRIVECDDEKRIVGLKNLTMNEFFFQGHFPGKPILPAIAHLAILTQIHRLGSGKNLSISIVKFLRVYQPIEPGETVSISISEPKENTTQFRFHREGTLVSRGTVNWIGNEY